MQPIATIDDPAVIQKILVRLGLSTGRPVDTFSELVLYVPHLRNLSNQIKEIPS